MLLVRSPLRISLGGGGTDLPSYYRKQGGYLIAASINKYVYTSAIKPFAEGIFLKYSEVERCEAPDDIKHSLFKEILAMESSPPWRIELTTLADIPAGTGLGSSGAFTVSTLKALKLFYNKQSSNDEIANQACHIEINRMQQPVGKQDQYASAIGGINEFIFHKDDSVEYHKLSLKQSVLLSLEEDLLMFFTGYSRSSASILEDQHVRSLAIDAQMISNLDRVKEMGLVSRDLLLRGDLRQFGLLMDDHWKTKIKRSPNMCPPNVREAYDEALQNGAVGGKLVGAGGGGFLMFLASDKQSLRGTMKKFGFREMHFRFDKLGAHVLQAD